MTPAEVVACVDAMRENACAAHLNIALDWQVDAVYGGARAAFHEAAKLLDFCAPKTCGTCADAAEPLAIEARDIGRWWQCGSATSSCSRGLASNVLWPATHGCPHWRRKDGAQ